MRRTYPPSSPGLLPWRHLPDCFVISAPAQPSSSLIQTLWLCLFTLDRVPPFIPLGNRAHHPPPLPSPAVLSHLLNLSLIIPLFLRVRVHA